MIINLTNSSFSLKFIRYIYYYILIVYKIVRVDHNKWFAHNLRTLSASSFFKWEYVCTKENAQITVTKHKLRNRFNEYITQLFSK